MVGGDVETFEKIRPLFEVMGKNVRHMGAPGAGQHTKMSNQILIAGTMIGVVESLLYAVRAGLGMDAVIDVIGSGAASSWSINNLGRKIAREDFSPGFFVKHFVKDMGIALAEVIGDTGKAAFYIQSGGFDHNTGRLYWAGYDDSCGFFTEVDINTSRC